MPGKKTVKQQAECSRGEGGGGGGGGAMILTREDRTDAWRKSTIRDDFDHQYHAKKLMANSLFSLKSESCVVTTI